MPEDATVDEDGVQLGGKRAAILYAHRLREAEAAVAPEEGVEAAANADGKTGARFNSILKILPKILTKNHSNSYNKKIRGQIDLNF